MAVIAATAAVLAEDAPAKRFLYEQDPFDQITLTDAHQRAVLKTRPLGLPAAQLPAQRSGKLRLRLVDRPETLYEVAWTDIAEVKSFAELLLAEAETLVAGGQYDDAYRTYALLIQSYAKTDRLGASLENFLFQNAAASYHAKRYDDALGLLLELHHRAPQRENLPARLDQMADQLIATHVADENFVAARGILDLMAKQLPNGAFPSVEKQRQALVQRATTLLDQARQQIAAADYSQALQACQQVMAIWPELPGARDLQRGIDREYPHIVVGVMLPAPGTLTDRLDDWASRRVARLSDRHLVELDGYDSGGGQYACPFGTMRQDESGLGIEFTLRQGIRFPGMDRTWTGHDLAQRLLAMADPDGGPFGITWGDVLGALSVRDVFQVQIALRRPHVRPEALLRISPLGTVGERSNGGLDAPGTGPYVAAAGSPGSVRYVHGGGSLAAAAPRLQQITERSFADGRSARSALRRGTIDALDRVAPWELPTLASAEEITVATYALPTVHVLIPNLRRPRVAQRAFRRALCYGIHRQAILDDVLLQGASLPGFVVLSGPFPVGSSLDDPIGTATDRRLSPRPYEPRLALILAATAARAIAAASPGADSVPGTGDGPGKAPQPVATADGASGAVAPLVLAYRPEPLARIACEAIQAHLKVAGIPLVLAPLAPAAADPLEQADLLYAELAMWEPVVDVHRLLGENGLAGPGSPQMHFALQRLARARNWNEARDGLREVHRIAHDEVAVVPLWQTYNYFAYRKALHGVVQRPVTLYQNVQQWTPAPPIEK